MGRLQLEASLAAGMAWPRLPGPGQGASPGCAGHSLVTAPLLGGSDTSCRLDPRGPLSGSSILPPPGPGISPCKGSNSSPPHQPLCSYLGDRHESHRKTVPLCPRPRAPSPSSQTSRRRQPFSASPLHRAVPSTSGLHERGSPPAPSNAPLAPCCGASRTFSPGLSVALGPCPLCTPVALGSGTHRPSDVHGFDGLLCPLWGLSAAPSIPVSIAHLLAGGPLCSPNFNYCLSRASDFHVQLPTRHRLLGTHQAGTAAPPGLSSGLAPSRLPLGLGVPSLACPSPSTASCRRGPFPCLGSLPLPPWSKHVSHWSSSYPLGPPKNLALPHLFSAANQKVSLRADPPPQTSRPLVEKPFDMAYKARHDLIFIFLFNLIFF